MVCIFADGETRVPHSECVVAGVFLEAVRTRAFRSTEVTSRTEAGWRKGECRGEMSRMATMSKIWSIRK